METVSPSTPPATISPAVGLIAAILLLLPVTMTFQTDGLPLGVLGFLVATLLLLRAARDYATPMNGWLIAWLLLALGLSVQSLVVTRQLYSTAIALSWWWVGALVVWLSATWSGGQKLDRLVFWLVITQVASAIIAFGVFHLHPTRLMGLLYNANGLGPSLMWGAIASLALVIGRIKLRWTLPAAVIIWIAWAGTVSLTAFAAAAIPIGLLLWWQKKVIRWKLVGLLVGLVIILGGVGFVTLKNTYVGHLITVNEIQTSFRQRQEFLNAALAEWRAKPWLGWGLGAYRQTFPRFTHQFDEQPLYAHNVPIQLLAETGAPLTLLFVVIVIGIGWRGWRFMRAQAEGRAKILAQALWLGWLAFSLEALIDFGWFFPAGQIWWLVASGVFLAYDVWPGLSSGWRIVRRGSDLIVGLALGWLSASILLGQQHSFSADQAFHANNNSKAINEAAKAVALTGNPNDVQLEAQARWLRRDANDLALAESGLRADLLRNPDNYFSHQWLGLVYGAEKKDQLASDQFKAAYDLDPQFHPDFAYNYILSLERLGRHQEALNLVHASIVLYSRPSFNPSTADALQRFIQLQNQLRS